MYNRYVRNDHGVYTRIPQEETEPKKNTPPPPPPPTPTPPSSPPPPPPSGGRAADGLTGFLRHFLDQFHLDRVDTGDLLLLAILFFLFKEDADEELLMALGLLLIL